MIDESMAPLNREAVRAARKKMLAARHYIVKTMAEINAAEKLAENMHDIPAPGELFNGH